MADKKILYIAKYTYGTLTYLVQITQENYDVDWERNEEIIGKFYFIEYHESTFPNGNRVGGFETLSDALTWSNEHFGNLYWTVVT